MSQRSHRIQGEMQSGRVRQDSTHSESTARRDAGVHAPGIVPSDSARSQAAAETNIHSMCVLWLKE